MAQPLESFLDTLSLGFFISTMGVVVEVCPLSRNIQVLTPGTCEGDYIWKQVSADEEVKMRSWGWGGHGLV